MKVFKSISPGIKLFQAVLLCTWIGGLFPFAASAQKFSSLSVKEKGRLDPFLHFVIDKDRAALRGMARVMAVNAEAPDPSVDILIRTRPWVTREELSQISPTLKLRTQAGDIFTAAAPISSLSLLATSEKVVFVSAAQKAIPQNNIAKSSDTDLSDYLGVAALSQGFGGYSGVEGEGVIVGIVDSGIDFRHPDFLTADNKSRILFLWDQTAPPGYPGTEWTKTQIDEQLGYSSCRSNIVNCLLIAERDDPGADGKGVGHGTHVTGTAAGRHPVFAGMAPKAGLIFVKTDFSHYVDGVAYVFYNAESLGKPAVVNLSLGVQYGPHDGTSNEDLAISNLIKPGKIVVVAGGNDRGSGVHSSATVTTTYAFGLSVQNNIDSAWTDLWHSGLDRYTVAVKINNGAEVSAGNGVTTTGTSSGVSVTINNATGGPNPNNNDNEVTINFTGSISAGWPITITYTYTGGSGPKRVDGWCSNSNGSDLRFNSPVDTMLVGSPGSSTGTITVGAYVSRNAWQSTEPTSYCISYPSGGTDLYPCSLAWPLGTMSSFSSPGPTRDGRLKPEITAPGNKIISARSQSISPGANEIVYDGAHRTMQGTSMAAPLVTGIVALHLQENPSLTTDQIKAILVGHARKDNQTENYGASPTPNNDWGYGKILGTPPAWPAPTDFIGVATSTVKINWHYTLTAQNQLGVRVSDAQTQASYGDLTPDATAFDLVNLSTNTQYSLKVSVFNDAGASTSTAVSVYTLAASPTGYRLISAQDTAISVQWGANQNPAGTQYRLDYWTLGGTTTTVLGTATNATASGLTASTTYYLRVNAQNGNNILAASSNTLIAQTLPPPPTSFAGALQGVSSITWTWDSVGGATQYKFYPSTGGAAVALTNPAFIQIKLSTNTAYSGRVSAVNAGGESALATSVTTYTLAAPPAYQAIAWAGVSSAAVNWAMNQNPTGTFFTLELSVNNFSSVSASSRTAVSTAAFTSLLPNTSYYFRVKAENGQAIASAYTPAVSSPTLAAVPSELTLTQLSSSTLGAAWQSDLNPLDTQFELSLSSTNFIANISTPLPFSPASAVTQADLGGLTMETTYYARVRARNRLGFTTEFSTASYFIPTNLIQSVDPSVTANLVFGNAALIIPPQAFLQNLTVTMQAPGAFPPAASLAAPLTGVNAGVEITTDKALLPLKRLTLTLTYSAGQAAGLNESQFVIARYEPGRSVWVPYASTPDPAANQVTALIDHLSLFQVMLAVPAGSLSGAAIKIFPNPVRPSQGQTMKFTGLPAGASIKLYTFQGELVRELTADGSGIAQWDGRNSGNQPVASEVYLAFIKSGGDTKTLKVMVER